MKYYQVLVFGAEQFNNGEYEGMTKLQSVIHNSKISRSIDTYKFETMDEAREFAVQYDEVIGMGASIQQVEVAI